MAGIKFMLNESCKENKFNNFAKLFERNKNSVSFKERKCKNEGN